MTYRSEIFKLSDTYIDQSAALSPMESTSLGIDLNQDKLDDFSLAAAQVRSDLDRVTLNMLNAIEPIDDIDHIAKAVMQERLESALLLHDSQEAFLLWNVLTSPPSDIRSIFELMPREKDDDFSNIASRLRSVGDAHSSWISTIETLAKEGRTTAARQVRGVIAQLESYALGGYCEMAQEFDPTGNYPELHSSALLAQESCASTARYLREDYLRLANPKDAVGPERYAIWSRHFTGADLDLRATYEWGVTDLKQINDRMWRVASKIAPDAKSLREVADALDHDPKYLVNGSAEVIRRLQDFTDAAIARMDGEYFDIDDRIKICQARLAPEGSASAPYYNPPSEDLSRPGTTWFPTLGRDEFAWWGLVSTWYHEAVPGHHLQCATVAIEQDRLSRFQRTAAWISGYGEGWALYAERFMDELGAFDDPGIEMGYLSGQALRAARIVVDIGMHLEYEDENGQVWNADSARELLNKAALLDEEYSASETDRYLGWPGQAISYKVGERVWMQAREDARVRLGSEFSLKKFHSHALRIGPMGLDPFLRLMKQWDGK